METTLFEIKTLIKEWLKVFVVFDKKVTSVVTEDGDGNRTEYGVPDHLTQAIENSLSYSTEDRVEKVFDLFKDGRFSKIRAIKIWKEMTGSNLKESKKVMDLVDIAYRLGIEEGKMETVTTIAEGEEIYSFTKNKWVPVEDSQKLKQRVEDTLV